VKLWAIPLGLVLLTAAVAEARPVIFYRGVVNAGSFLTPGLPNGSIARGSIFSLFGRELGPQDPATVSEFPLNTSLGGAEVEVCRDDDCRAALPLFVSAGQVNAVMPSDAPLGDGLVRVIVDGERGPPHRIRVVESSFGVFSVNTTGYGPGVIQNVETSTDRPINSTVRTARPGQIVVLWGTGLGPGLNADNVPAQQGDLPVGVEVFVGGVAVTDIRYKGRTSCCSGVDQIIFELPANTPRGCYVPVTVRLNGMVVSNTVTLAVSDDAGPCRDDFNPVGSAMRRGDRMALLLPSRIDALTDVLVAEPTNVVTDWFYASIRDEPGGEFFFNPLYSLPPIGSCTTFGSKGDDTGLAWIGRWTQGGEALDAGQALALVSGGEQREINSLPAAADIFARLVGRDAAAGFGESLIFNSGGTAALPGGADVGPINAAFGALRGVDWLDRDELRTVDRTGSVTVRWSGRDETADLVLIIGAARHEALNAGGQFLCVAEPNSGALTVPAHVVQALPESPERAFDAPAEIMAVNANLRNPVQVESEGLDAVYVVSSVARLKTVVVE